MANEKEVGGLSGWLVVFVMLLAGAGAVWVMATLESSGDGLDWIKAAGVLVLVLDGVCAAGLTVVNPNEASVVTLFGVYKGTIKRAGFCWVNPLTTRRKLSLRVRNFESAKLKVNERDGNPIEIAAVVVWRIVETFEAVFNVDVTAKTPPGQHNQLAAILTLVKDGEPIIQTVSSGGVLRVDPPPPPKANEPKPAPQQAAAAQKAPEKVLSRLEKLRLEQAAKAGK